MWLIAMLDVQHDNTVALHRRSDLAGRPRCLGGAGGVHT